MDDYIFEFNLETGREEESTWGIYAIRYHKTEEGIKVEVGDGYRHYFIVDATYWNRILKIIKGNELDKDGVDAIVKGLMRHGIPEEYAENFILAVRNGIIKFID